MKIYKKTQLNKPNPEAQQKAMESMSELANMMNNYAEEQNRRREEIQQKAEETSSLFLDAGLSTTFIDDAINALEYGNLSNIQNISSQLSINNSFGPMNVT